LYRRWLWQRRCLVVVPLYYQRTSERGSILVAEAVNDHLRILSSQHPLDIENGGMHQVKPWCEGRLDFAPVVRFLGDQDVARPGGAVGYYLDRKAAVFVFHHRLRAVLLFVFRADGLPWPTRGVQRIGHSRAQVSAARGSILSSGVRGTWATCWCPTWTCRR